MVVLRALALGDMLLLGMAVLLCSIKVEGKMLLREDSYILAPSSAALQLCGLHPGRSSASRAVQHKIYDLLPGVSCYCHSMPLLGALLFGCVKRYTRCDARNTCSAPLLFHS